MIGNLFKVSNFNQLCLKVNQLIWNYSNLWLEYAPVEVRIPVKCANFLTEIKVDILLFEHVMQSHLPRMHDFFTLDIQYQFINVSLKRLKRSLQFIIHLSNFRFGVLASLDISAVRCSMFSRLS